MQFMVNLEVLVGMMKYFMILLVICELLNCWGSSFSLVELFKQISTVRLMFFRFQISIVQ